MSDITGKISLSDTKSFKRDDFSGQEYILRETNVGFNALLITINGRHPKKRMVDTTRSYLILEGTGTFTIDERIYEVAVGDLFVVGPNHTYEYKGVMKLFEFNVSPDNSFKDEVLG